MGHLWLIGMMGSGKTTIGKHVSIRLGLPFIDTDDRVVATSGRTIAELFAVGEASFRELERTTISEIAAFNDHVVSTGGGVVLDERNVATMHETGTTVLLDAEPHVLEERVKGSTERPLLTGGRPLSEIAGERAPIYRDAADVVVDTSGRTVRDIVKEVAACAPM